MGEPRGLSAGPGIGAGGVDRAAAKDLGLRVLQAPGLPGRTAPVTAAAAIRDSVYHILWELEA
ncbi:MAG: hypothetical protein ACLR1T_08800 [Evtepia gabavorous]